MESEITTNELMEFLQVNMATKEDLAHVQENMATKVELTSLKKDVATIQENMVTRQEHDGLVAFLQENMVTKEDAKNFATKEDLHEFRSEMMSTVDRVIKQQEIHGHEIAALRGASLRHEDRLDAVESRFSP